MMVEGSLLDGDIRDTVHTVGFICSMRFLSLLDALRNSIRKTCFLKQFIYLASRVLLPSEFALAMKCKISIILVGS